MAGRNELCPCGSGKKYKKCCLQKDEARDIARNKITFATNQFEATLKKISDFSIKEYKDYRKKCELDFGVTNYELENLMNVYYLANYKYNKQSSMMLDYFNKNKQTINRNDEEIIKNTLNSYMSIYQISQKEINKILLRDILLNENVEVEDIDLFSTFEAGDFLLARIVLVGDTNILVDKTVKINESKKCAIKKDMDKRYNQTKKKFRNKKQCLINNIKFMYQKLIESRREYIAEIPCSIVINNAKEELKETSIQQSTKSMVDEITKPILELKEIVKPVIQLNDKKKEKEVLKKIQQPVVQKVESSVEELTKQQPKLVATESEHKIVIQVDAEGVARLTPNIDIMTDGIKENQKVILESKHKKYVMARQSTNADESNSRRLDRRLEDKLKQRLGTTKKIEGKRAGLEFIRQEKIIQEREEKLREEKLKLEKKYTNQSLEIVATQVEEPLKDETRVKEPSMQLVETEVIDKNCNVENQNNNLTNKVETLSLYKSEPIESRIENISMSKIEQQIQSKIENNIVAKMTLQQPQQGVLENKKIEYEKSDEQKQVIPKQKRKIERNKQEQKNQQNKQVKLQIKTEEDKQVKQKIKTEEDKNVRQKIKTEKDKKKSKEDEDVNNNDKCKIYDILISKVENEYKDKCIEILEKFKKFNKSYTGSENSWAAAIEYYAKKPIDETVTQEQISKKYDISARTLGKRFKELKIS